ncbi:MAG: fibronectin [Candidatus Marinimicrobia bacterium]|nr:fibronectin [Candidatus Neomarinimicrobiota bacterium]
MKKMKIIGLISFITLWMIGGALAQVDENDTRYFRIGSLQSYVTAYGSDRAYNNTYYEGLKWPSDYLRVDNAVIKRYFIAVENLTDARGIFWEKWGTGVNKSYVLNSIYPTQLKQIAKFEAPILYVDGSNISSPYLADVDEYDFTQIPDRVIVNTINTSIGLTVTLKVSVFSQQYHDNYIIKEFTYTNTGYVDYTPTVVLTDTLHGVRIGWSTRYQCGREGGERTDGNQTWGKFSWVTVRGEDYPDHASETLTEADGPVDWIRSAISWFGQSENVAWDNIGAPLKPYDGRLMSPQFVGQAILHVDKSTNDHSDDPYQPVTLGWHAGDTYPGVGDLKDSDRINMGLLYEWLGGTPYPSAKAGATSRIGTTVTNGRYWELSTNSDPIKRLTDKVIPYKSHGDGGGTNQWFGYGPWDIAPGESVTIIEMEGVNGISRALCFDVGRNWKKCYDNQSVAYTFTKPDGSTMTAKYSDGTADTYKNLWVYTGMDSIKLTFSRAKRNYDSGFNIPQPPQPPAMFNVESLGDKIRLTWAPSSSEAESDFAGYKVYRAVGKTDTTFECIATLPKTGKEYNDVSAIRGYSYYYYITAYNDGSNNTSGVFNPKGSLESGHFYTKTNQPAYLQRPQGSSLKNIRVVPNPFNVAAENLQYIEEDDKIMFLDIPGQCDIRIFTERGDLIKTIHHTSGTGDESWQSLTSSRQVVVSGIYIAYFEVTKDCYDQTTGELLYKKGDHATRKIIIIR